MQFNISKYIWSSASLCALTVSLAMVACDDPDAVITETEEELTVESLEPDPEQEDEEAQDRALQEDTQADVQDGVIDLSAPPSAVGSEDDWRDDDDHWGRRGRRDDDDHWGRRGRRDDDDDHWGRRGRRDDDDDHWGRNGRRDDDDHWGRNGRRDDDDHWGRRD